MEKRIQRINAVRITIERRKLARDKKSIQKIFEVLEKCQIPCECMAINIDWLAIVVREAERGKISGFAATLEQELKQTEVYVNGDIIMLYIENAQMTSRRIGMIVSSLAIQDVDIIMQRYIRCEDRLVLGVSADTADRAGEIIAEIMDSDLYLSV